MILYTTVSSLLNGFAVAVFGVLVLIHDPKSKINRSMALLCFVVAIWAFCWSWFASIDDYNIALFATRLLNFFAVFIPVFYLRWILNLLEIEKQKINKLILLTGYLLTLLFALFSFSDYFIGIKTDLYFNYYASPKLLHPFYLFFCYLGLVGYAFHRLIKSYKKATGYKKAQIKYVFLGSLVGFGGGATNYLLYYGIPIPPIGNPLVAIGYGFFTYAIIRYRLMDIKIMLGKGMAYVLSLMTIIGSAFALIYFNGRLTAPLSIKIIAPFIAILSVLIFQIHKFYEKLAEQYFYRSFYNTKIAISDLEERLTQVLELELLSSLVINTLTSIFSLKKVAVITKNIKDEEFVIQDSINFDKKKLNLLIRDQEFKFYLIREKDRNGKDFQYLKKLKIEILLPLVFDKKNIGVIILGGKKSGNDFSTNDLKLLKELSRQISIALKNATLFAEINKRRQELENFYILTVKKGMELLKLKKKIRELEKRLIKK